MPELTDGACADYRVDRHNTTSLFCHSLQSIVVTSFFAYRRGISGLHQHDSAKTIGARVSSGRLLAMVSAIVIYFFQRAVSPVSTD